MKALRPPGVQTNSCDLSVDFQGCFFLISQVKDSSRPTQNRCLVFLPPGFTCEMRFQVKSCFCSGLVILGVN